jgi:hypothetical protein
MVEFDIVIVNWNSGQQLVECLSSLSNSLQSTDFILSKCIVVDNASSDQSADIPREVPYPLEIIKNQDNKGFAFASNQGATLGSSPLILFLNPDIKLFAESISKAVLYMNELGSESIGILGIQLVDSHGSVHLNAARFPTLKSFLYQMMGFDRLWPKRFPSMVMTEWDHRESKVVDHVEGSFYLVRRKVFDDLKGFDERFFMYLEDLDFSLRAAQAGWKSFYLANNQAYHQGGGTTSPIKARRLYYYLHSQVLYSAKHFGFWSGIGIMVASISMGFLSRLVWHLFRFSGEGLLNTCRAYGMLWLSIPRLISNMKYR